MNFFDYNFIFDSDIDKIDLNFDFLTEQSMMEAIAHSMNNKDIILTIINFDAYILQFKKKMQHLNQHFDLKKHISRDVQIDGPKEEFEIPKFSIMPRKYAKYYEYLYKNKEYNDAKIRNLPSELLPLVLILNANFNKQVNLQLVKDLLIVWIFQLNNLEMEKPKAVECAAPTVKSQPKECTTLFFQQVKALLINKLHTPVNDTMDLLYEAADYNNINMLIYKELKRIGCEDNCFISLFLTLTQKLLNDEGIYDIGVNLEEWHFITYSEKLDVINSLIDAGFMLLGNSSNQLKINGPLTQGDGNFRFDQINFNEPFLQQMYSNLVYVLRKIRIKRQLNIGPSLDKFQNKINFNVSHAINLSMIKGLTTLLYDWSDKKFLLCPEAPNVLLGINQDHIGFILDGCFG